MQTVAWREGAREAQGEATPHHVPTGAAQHTHLPPKFFWGPGLQLCPSLLWISVSLSRMGWKRCLNMSILGPNQRGQSKVPTRGAPYRQLPQTSVTPYQRHVTS